MGIFEQRVATNRMASLMPGFVRGRAGRGENAPTMLTLLAAIQLKLFVLSVMLAQAADQTLDPALLPQLLAAWNAHAWPLVGAIVTYGLVTLAKQGWFSAWVASKLPARYLPYIAVLIGVAGTSSIEIIAGKPWVAALTDGLMSGMGAVFVHQSVVESARNGKEIVPETKGVALARSIPPPPMSKTAPMPPIDTPAPPQV